MYFFVLVISASDVGDVNKTNFFIMFSKSCIHQFQNIFSGYDGVPVDGMQGLDLGSHHGGSTYGTNEGSNNVHGGDNLNFDPDVPSPPQDNNQVAAWYDTDL